MIMIRYVILFVCTCLEIVVRCAVREAEKAFRECRGGGGSQVRGATPIG